MTLPGNTASFKMPSESGENKLERAVTCLCFFCFVECMVFWMLISTPVHSAPEADVLLRVKDRPVLESVEAVYKARTTGVCDFYVGNDHYVVRNLPKEYVDYSSWWVRMP